MTTVSIQASRSNRALERTRGSVVGLLLAPSHIGRLVRAAQRER